MIYHQMDFMKEAKKMVGSIKVGSISLVMSSPPFKILEDQFRNLFQIFDCWVHPQGFVLIDAPVSMDLFTQFAEMEDYCHWSWRRSHFVENMYPGIDQWIHVFSIQGQHLPIVPRVLEPTRQREMGHECEFCPDLIRTLIERYSSVGQVVLDPFCGTGTVPGEAGNLNRYGVGCDLRPVENIREEYKRYRVVGAPMFSNPWKNQD